ncbi:hypothetical protein G5714_016504 [Onychostoma macrolepis]|uniref:SWIM-type domain-containing protein n=1 Tax=Onychostoma macrolepis TaxID=369639 RepID=A0A7J6C999_9TELE|nr:hypothetical protein G5714_016504 [Onychostoma macrolepis]
MKEETEKLRPNAELFKERMLILDLECGPTNSHTALCNDTLSPLKEKFRCMIDDCEDGQLKKGPLSDQPIPTPKMKLKGCREGHLVLHSQRLNEPPLKPWVILSSSGQVECAHCTCMTGIAESCTHVGAVLFKIEAAVRIRGTKTVTDVPAYWMMPANVEKVQAEVGYKIDFTSGAVKRVALDKCISRERGMTGIRTRSVSVSSCSHEPTLSDVSPLLQIMHTQTRARVCLSGMEEYHHHYIDPVKAHVVPKSLQHLRDPGKDECNLPDLLQHCNTLTYLVAITETQAAAVEARTRLQHRSPVWYTSKAGRIIASNMHVVLSASVDKPAPSTVAKVCYPKKTATSSAIGWGIDNEETARQAYVSLKAPQHMNLKVEQCGFIINPLFPEVGASPDGLIHCTCCGKGCLEIKCTFKHRNSSILQACADESTFCLQVTNGTLHLKDTHKHYSQVQTQIFVTGSNFCDFCCVDSERLCYGSGLSGYTILENSSKEGTGLLPQGFTT